MQRILIIAPNWIGDAVMSQPLLAQLKISYPNSQIDVLASPWVAPIYRACTEVHQVIEGKLEHKQLQWGLRKQLAKHFQAMQYHMCFVLPNSFKSALIPWLANIPVRVGYRGELRLGLINFSLKNPSKQNRPPMVEHYLALGTAVIRKDHISSKSSITPKLNVSASALQAVEIKLVKAAIDRHAIYVFCPGAEYGPTKRWPSEYFGKLAQSLIADNQNAQIILLGSKSDRVLAENIQMRAHNPTHIHNWCGDTSLDEAIALIGLSKAMVSNDSGLMHIGAALKTPQVAIFGSSDPKHTPPLSDKAKIIWLNMSCSPCHKRECPLGHMKCLKDISPEQIFQSIKSLDS
jgi:heptosyltransferase II